MPKTNNVKPLLDRATGGKMSGGGDASGGLGIVLLCSQKGCSKVTVGPPQAGARSTHNPIHSTLQGSAKRLVPRNSQKRRPLPGRALRGRRAPGATLRLPPATLAQAFSLQSQPPMLPCTQMPRTLRGTTPTARCGRSVVHTLALAMWILGSFLAAAPAVAQTDPAAESPPKSAENSQKTVKTNDPQGESEPKHEEPPTKNPIDLSSPRATMQTFLRAVEDAMGEKPTRIADAVRCLDISELEEKDRDQRAQTLARRLFTIIDKKGVILDDLPESHTEAEYVFYRAKAQSGQEPSATQISFELDFDTGVWLFTPETLTSIVALEAELQEAPAKKAETDSKIPAARRDPRATMKTFLAAMNPDAPDLAAATDCLARGHRPKQAWGTKSKEFAVQLKSVMDKTKLVVVTEIPTTTPGDKPYVWHSSELGNIEIGRIAEGEFAGEWRFTPSTIDAMEALYKSLEDQEIIRELKEAGVTEQLTLALRIERLMPPELRETYFHLAGWQWAALGALLLLGWPIRIAVTGLVGLLLQFYLARKGIKIDRGDRQRVLRWAGTVACVLIWLLVVEQLRLPDGLLAVLLPGLKLLVAVSLAWFGYRLVDVVAGYVVKSKDVQLTQFDDLLLPLLRTVLRTLVAVVVILFVMEWIGYTPRSVLGALGIGGVAIAFAAKDTLGNFFGSITVLFDRPFGIGDWVVIGSVEGTVEHVGFRSTRIRTFYNSRVTIPNSVMATSGVDNYGERRFRRVKTMLSLTYDTPPEKIDAFCEGVRELIRLHHYTRKDYYHVYFNQFAPSSLDVLLYMFLETPDWSTELRERHRLFIDILNLARQIGVEFAYPTQTLLLQRAPANDAGDQPTGTPPDGAQREGVDRAASVFEQVYGPSPTKPGPVLIEPTPRSKGPTTG